MAPPGGAADLVALTSEPIAVGALHDWAVRPGCGAVVCFTGTVRDHAGTRRGVQRLTYEAYGPAAEDRMRAIVRALRARWPGLGAVALVHRVGCLGLGEVAVAVVVSAPHRAEAFAAARAAIDTLKRAVPIWKKETWDGGEDWGTDATDLAGEVELVTDGGDGARC